MPTLQAARYLPTVQLSQLASSSHGSTPALPPRNYYLDETGNLDVPSVAGQSVTELVHTHITLHTYTQVSQLRFDLMLSCVVCIYMYQ